MFSEKGQTLMELIVVILVSTLVIGALVFATIASLRNAQFAKNQAQATKLAQEGIERVRSGRDRDLGITISGTPVNHWNGTGGSDSIWNYHISGNCDRPDLERLDVTPPIPPGVCYLKLNSTTGELTYISGFASNTFPESTAEGIPPLPDTPIFQRVIIMSDNLNHNEDFDDDDWQNQKEVTVIVRWKDFSGPHESRLTTILRKL